MESKIKRGGARSGSGRKRKFQEPAYTSLYWEARYDRLLKTLATRMKLEPRQVIEAALIDLAAREDVVIEQVLEAPGEGKEGG